MKTTLTVSATKPAVATTIAVSGECVLLRKVTIASPSDVYVTPGNVTPAVVVIYTGVLSATG